MPQAQVRLPDLSVWKAETLRVTAFHEPGVQTLNNTWWEDVTGAIPDSKTMKPREGGYEVAGTYAGGVLTLKADTFRFDWLFTPSNSPDKPTTGLPSIGPLPNAMESFLKSMQAWWAKAPPITRLAFGTVVLQEVQDRIAGYKLINDYLPAVDVDAEGSTEFSYSINRPRTANDLAGIKINRLSRWSVGLFQPISFTMIVGQAPVASSVTGEPAHALRLELDINTEGERRDPLPNQQLPALIDRLVAFGTEIITRGDLK
jgi:hypothetical protein